ncbi:unnamed protein product [Effrenium voratum]|uniref:Uncharacterized protein n=1 Tax=Effrenium voratum TaxID=2562239 RepID=A0AA36ITV8_9DINO|nr:unnamed protein product [Effrenium voratum]
MDCCDTGHTTVHHEKWVNAGYGRGAYESVTDVVYVGEGKGSIEKREAVVGQSFRFRPAWCVFVSLLLLLSVGLWIIWWFYGTRDAGFSDTIVTPVYAPLPTPEPQEIIIRHHIVTSTRNKYIRQPVPGAPHVVIHHVYEPHAHYSCGDREHWRAWSSHHKRWCCWQEDFACPVKVIKKDKYIPVTHHHAVAVPMYYKVKVPGKKPHPVYVKVKVPAPAQPPKLVKFPVPVPGAKPPPHIHYKYVPDPVEVKVPHIVYDKKEVDMPVTVKKYVPRHVTEAPETIYKTRKVYIHDKDYDCVEGYHDWKHLWNDDKRRFCCWKANRGCPQTKYHTRTKIVTRTKYVDVPVPSPPKIVVQHHYIKHKEKPQTHFDCNEGFSNWYFGWSPLKKEFCCAHENRGCPGTWKGKLHISMMEAHGGGHAHAKGEGHASGKIYDCHAGFSNWLHGWSDSKKTWCCSREQKGCVKFECFDGDQTQWHSEKQSWCCSNFQRGCPHTTLSPLGCRTPCTHSGNTALCMDRIKWTSDHIFSSHPNACALAYSKVQVECDVCRACSIEAAGCDMGHVGTSKPFDCNAALNNFFRAWSPPKKHWCCTTEGKGCEGSGPPSVDPGAGMVWKHMQVNGYWTWMAVAVSGGGGGGGGVVSLPYDCHAGLANWHLGWSSPKKTWCCAKQHLGCEAGAGGTGGGGAFGGGASGGGAFGGAGGGGHPPGAAGAGMVWKWQSDAGHWHWIQVHFNGKLPYDCRAGLPNFKIGWSQPKKDWCCPNTGLGCM